jgi:hypothetical protein
MESGTKRTGFEKFYAIYLMCAILAPLAYLLTYKRFAFNRIDLSLIITFSIFFFYFISGFTYWQSPGSRLSSILVQLSLLLQSIRIDILGIKFYSYYGPYLSVGYRDDVNFHFDMDINVQFMGANAYEEYVPYTIFYFNLVTIFLLIKFIKRKKEKSLEDTFLMEE